MEKCDDCGMIAPTCKGPFSQLDGVAWEYRLALSRPWNNFPSISNDKSIDILKTLMSTAKSELHLYLPNSKVL